MSMIRVENLTFAYPSSYDNIFENVNFQIDTDWKLGFIGRNGRGKTTFLNLLLGKYEYHGKIQASVQFDYFPYPVSNKNRLTADILSEVCPLAEEWELLRELSYLEVRDDVLWRPFFTLSNGEQTKVLLAALFLNDGHFLLIDEPTNHLDIAAIEWLENYVKHYPFAVVLVSHDRMFLDHVVDEIVEIEFGKTQRYVGDYSHYLKAKDEYLKKNHEAYIRQQQEIHRLEDLIEKFRYKKNKAAFAKSKQKYLDRMDRIEDSTSDTSQMKAVFTCARKGGKQVLEVEDLKVGYDKVLSDVSFQLLQGQRMAIVGPNGIGKSTLIKTLVKELPSLSGSFKFGHQIDVGYFNQESAQMKSNKNVLDELWDMDPDATQTQIRNTLASFLFTQDEVFKEVNDLSGGERVRLALAKLMLEHDNVLLLDEPTNHLDIPAKEALESALEKYDGTILFVSHDRMFLKKMATRVLEMGSISKVYDLNYEEYLEKKASNELVESVAKVEKEVKPQTVSFTDLKAIKNRVAKLEVLLEEAEQDLEAMRELRYEPEYYQDYRKMEELDAKIDDKHNEIAALMQEWEEKMAMLE